jgi:co-chaperonin GroES (HSP10)
MGLIELPEDPLKPKIRDYFKPAEWPGVLQHWYLAVQIPVPPEKTSGGIIVPEEYRDTTAWMTYIGLVRAIGWAAYSAKTRSQIDLAATPSKPKVGDWVLMAKHAGTRVKLATGELFVIAADTEILSIVPAPDAIDCMAV